MAHKFTVVTLGLGGIGGYVGGKLAAYASDSKAIDVIFVARGAHEEAIRAHGLKLITPADEQIVHSTSVTHDPTTVLRRAADLVIVSVKSYDLESSIHILKPCIGRGTIILPLLNGVDASEKIRQQVPEAEIWEGCMYIVSRLVAPGIVKVTSNYNTLYFGSIHGTIQKLQEVESLFRAAGIDAHFADNITQTIWEKFIFISPLATLTSYLDLNIGGIVRSRENLQLMEHLVTELKNIAEANHIPHPENVIQKTMERLKSLPAENTSSMHDDFHKGKKTELDSLTGYVVRKGRELGISAPYYQKIYTELSARSQ